MNFDDRLRSALAHDPLPVVPPGFVDDIVDALPRARGGPAQRVRALGFTVAVVIAVSVGVWVVGPSGWLVGPAASPSSGTGTASAPTSASPTEAPPGLAAWTHLAWQDVSPAFGGSSGPIVAGTSWSGGYVLVGATNASGTNGAIWYSADGRVWQRGAAGDGGSFEGMRFVGVAASGGRLVAVAYPEDTLVLRPAAIVWYSTDGAVWFPSQSDRVVLNAGIAAGPDGFVVYGVAFPARPVMQYSRRRCPVGRAHDPERALTAIPSPRSWRLQTGSLPSADHSATPWAKADPAWRGGPPMARRGTPARSTQRSRWVIWCDGPMGNSGRRAAFGRRVPYVSGIPGFITWSSTDGGQNWRELGDSLLLPSGDTTIYDAGRLVRLQAQDTPDMPWATWSADGVAWVPLRMDGATPVTGSAPCRGER